MTHDLVQSEPPLDSGEASAGMRIVGGAAIAVAAVSCAAFLPTAGAQLVLGSASLAAYAWVVPDARAALISAGVAYLFLDGFLVNHYGDLSWDGAASLAHVGLLTLTVLPPSSGRGWTASARSGRWPRNWSASSASPARPNPDPGRRPVPSDRTRRRRLVADLLLVAVTVGLFVALGLLVKAVERL